MTRRALSLAASVLASALLLSLAGCAHRGARTLYEWDGYEDQVYGHLKSGDADAAPQIAALEAGLQKMSARNGAVPPGYQAHLALLYFQTGDDAKALAALQAERAAFPEFGPYMDFLLARYKKN